VAALGPGLEVDYEWMKSRFPSKTLMETPGIPSTRWFDATLLPKDQVSQPDTVQAMFVMGHGVNTITRMPEAVRGHQRRLDLLVVCDPYPTAWSVLSEGQGRHLPFTGLHQLRDGRLSHRLERSLQWGEKIVEPVFESKNDYDTMYLLARKLGFADLMVQEHQGRKQRGVGGSISCARSIVVDGRQGYCGQSPNGSSFT